MKYYIVFILSFLLHSNLSSQVKPIILKSLLKNKNETFKGFILNDSLVAEFFEEYRFSVLKHDIELENRLDEIRWILIEPESNTPQELSGFNLGKIDRERKLILLSKLCLLDYGILKATLFRELSHYLGLPYNSDCCEIMRVNKPKGYSYAWTDDIEIREIEFEKLYQELIKIND
ncbi:hypothetical protein [Litoribaculum gwangyangense]|uniref:Peptidase M10 metallopeptidase domain-containing protein n=1 Tax=Litoribaculum gwangyangense TaxID=1130722 RepID=A0ABP9BXN8_9FLAO